MPRRTRTRRRAGRTACYCGRGGRFGNPADCVCHGRPGNWRDPEDEPAAQHRAEMAERLATWREQRGVA